MGWERESVEVPTVCSEFYDGLLFVGIGAEIRVFDTINSFDCLIVLPCLEPGTLVRGIHFFDRNKHSKVKYEFPCVRSTIITIFGSKETISLLWDRSSTESIVGKFSLLWRMEEAKDWIWDVIIGNMDQENRLELVRISAHNVIEIWDFENKKLLRTIESPDNSILYSAKLYYSDEKGLLAGCGTVFNQVFIWAPLRNSDEILVRLDGHEGVIFGITWDEFGNSVVSTSDDRSIRIWDDIWNDHVRCSVLYGHSARVWRSKWIGNMKWNHSESGNDSYEGNLLLTCSEDMTCRIWNTNESKCVGIYHGHSGKNVWSIAIDSKRNLAVSTGADGAVKIWSILSILDRFQGGVKSKVPFPGSLVDLHPAAENDYVQVLEILDSSRVLIATRKGFLASLLLPSLEWKIIHFRENSTFRFMRTSPNNSSFPSHVVLGEDAGYLTLLSTKEDENSTAIRVFAHKRITSLFWPDGDQIFSGGYETEGFCCKWWTIDSNNESKSPQFVLRATLNAEKEIIRSLVISPILPGKIIAGDAKGSVFFYDYSSISLDPDQCTQTPLKPCHSFLRIHGKERVSSLFITNNKEILSVGRDGRLCNYHWTTSGCELASTGKIRKRIDNTEMLLSITSEEEEQLFVVGFYGGKIVVEGLDLGAQFLSIDCGGLHRPHDFKFLRAPSGEFDASYYICAFLQRKFIYIHQSSSLLQNFHSFPVQRTLIPALHGLQVNTITFLDKNIFLTGSEDTTMKLVELLPSNDNSHNNSSSSSSSTSSLKVYQTLRGQASSIRCFSISNENDNDHSILFSGGGEYCLVAWNLCTEQKQCAIAKKFIKRKQADNRVMCVSSFLIPNTCNDSSSSSLHIVFMGLSSAIIEIVGYNSIKREFTVLGSLSGHFGPILSVEHISIVSNENSSSFTDYLLTSSTDGRILLWDVSRFTNFYLAEEKIISHDDSKFESSDDIRPIVELNQIHQSGINCISSIKLEQTDDFENYLVASCGDDQAISCILLQFRRDSTHIELLSKKYIPCAHRAAVTCVRIFGNLIFSTGPDQRVSVWKINITDSKLDVIHVESYFSEIADASCLDVAEYSESGKLRVIVGGMGVQSLILDNN